MKPPKIWTCYRCLCREEGEAPGTIPLDLVGYVEPDDPDARCSSCDSQPSARERQLAATKLVLAHVMKGPQDRRESKDRNRGAAGGPNVPHRKAYSLGDAAELLSISMTKIKDLVRDKKISIVRVGSRRRILNVEIDRYLLSNDGKRRT
jgi:excisionase family DNA binding protein